MLTKDTVHVLLRRGIIRSLSPASRNPMPETGELPTYQVLVPKDKLDLLVGMRLDERYYVLSLLGQGGMSLVYKAKDLKTGEIVAVKCLRTQVLGDENVVKRFKREADVLNRLNHPRIVQFFGYGTNKRGQPYFVMDYLIGTSLSEILRTQGRLELGRFQDIFVQVAAAIGHAHKHDAVHRDIKPGNIMLVERGGTADYVKIVDFGIAKVTEGTQRLTRLGEVWGSPIYMSPEQCMGSTTIDTRTDIYSLGIVMYEALTGEVPFLGRNYADTMMKQISEDPPTFKQANSKVQIPDALEKIVFRAIKKRPEERYQTMGELKRDLERALNDSLGILPRQPTSLLSISGKQIPREEDKNQDARRVTSEQLQNPKVEKFATESQQKVTAEDVPRFSTSERLNSGENLKPKSTPATQTRVNDEPAANLDFNPPAGESRLKFELTGPQIISASMEGEGSAQQAPSAARGPRVSRQSMNKQEASRPPSGTPEPAARSASGKTGSRTRRGRTSRNRLAASPPTSRAPDTTGGASRKTRGSETSLKQIFIVILILLAAAGVAFANREYLDVFIKEVFTFPVDEKTPSQEQSSEIGNKPETKPEFESQTGESSTQVQGSIASESTSLDINTV